MVSNRLMMGTSDTTFSPDGVATRAMITTILYRLEGCPAVENSGAFTDVAQGAWYSEAVNWAAEKSLVEGYGNGQYRPNGKLTWSRSSSSSTAMQVTKWPIRLPGRS